MDPTRSLEDLPQQKVVIVGAGVAGLTAALTLAEAGLAPLVLEADPQFPGGRFGGRPATEFTYAGRRWRFLGEHGIHGLWSQYYNLRALLARHHIHPPLIAAHRQEWVYGRGSRVNRTEIGRALRDSLVPAPFHYLALLASPSFLAMLSPLDLLRIPWVGMNLLTMLAVDPMEEGDRLDGLTVQDFLLGWPSALQAFVAALSRSGLSTGARDVPLAGFIALFRFYSLLRRDACAHEYLRGDPGAHIIGPLVAALHAAGGQVIQGVSVTRLEQEETGLWRIYWQRNTDEVEAASGTVAAQRVVLATDAPSAKRILCHGQTTASRAAHLRWPEGRATATVRLWFKAAPKLSAESGMFGGDFILDNFFWLHSFQEAFAEWHRATGGSAVESHIYGPTDLLAQPDVTLLALAGRDLGRAFPEVRGSLAHASLQRNQASHTLFSVGPPEGHLGVTTPWHNLYCCGDWVRHETPALFLERACVTGVSAANAIRSALGLAPQPLLPHAGPEPGAAAVQWMVRLGKALAGTVFATLPAKKKA